MAHLGSEAAGQDINKAVFREAVVMQMTWPGAPTIYYGDEAGLCGFTDPDNRRTYPWGREDRELTKTLWETGKVMGIPLVDHLIIGDGIYYSFKEHGLM